MEKTRIQVNGPKGLQAFAEIHSITSQYPKINRVEYMVEEDIMILDLENYQSGETMQLTIEGVRRNKDVKAIVKIKFQGTLDLECFD
jgi:hypothetical protein